MASSIFRRLPLGLVMALAMVAGGVSWAEGTLSKSEDLKLDLKAFKVLHKANGEEILVSADKIKPKEIVEYQVRYSNTGDRLLRNIQATLPIPTSLEYIPGTATPSNPSASLDGKSFAPIPLKRKVKAVDGTEKTILVPYAEYRFLRWSLSELGAGKSATVSARARLQ
jgi:uncharacterized repeat protein (TIGR01451 family)